MGSTAKLLPTAISFSGCGFLGVYYLGAIQCLKNHGQSLLESFDKYGGTSAGSLAAATLLTCPQKLSRCKELTYDLAATVRKLPFGALSSGFKLSKKVEEMADDILPVNAHELASGRLYLSVTERRPRRNHLVSQFSSREHLIQKFFDGGFTNNLINFEGEETVFVTPFSGSRRYICPPDAIGRLNITAVNQDFCVNMKNVKRGKDALLPPSKERLDKYYNQGFTDTLTYLAKLQEMHPYSFSIGPKQLEGILEDTIKQRIRRKSKKSKH